jgi:hypothetical protein
MKYLTIEEFVRSLTEEELWKIIDEYETTQDIEDAQFLRQKAREFCDKYYYMDYMSKIALYTYRHFTLKYKEMMK